MFSDGHKCFRFSFKVSLRGVASPEGAKQTAEAIPSERLLLLRFAQGRNDGNWDSNVMKIKFIDRGFKENIALIPGWATDWRIFAALDLNYNYLLPVEFDAFHFEGELIEQLDKLSLGKISLFGWSMGGFMAADFALKNPEKTGELILLSIRQKHEPALLKDIESKLKAGKNAYLYKFYLACFSEHDRQGLAWFKKNIFKSYIKEMELNRLIEGLRYLLEANINLESLAVLKKVRIYHGGQDKIAPLNEAMEFKLSCSWVEFICIQETGHIPFLSYNFKQNFYQSCPVKLSNSSTNSRI